MIARGGSVKDQPAERIHVPVLKDEVVARFQGDRQPEDVAGWIGEPGDRGTVLAHDPALVLREAVVAQELDATGHEVVHRRLDVRDLEVQRRVRGGPMVVLRIDEHPLSAGQLQHEHAVLLGQAESQRLGVEGPRGADVIGRKAGEGGCVAQHVGPPRGPRPDRRAGQSMLARPSRRSAFVSRSSVTDIAGN